MNSRMAIIITSGAAVAALIALVVVVYVAGTSAGEPSSLPENGSLLHPRLQREVQHGYVIAELYQDVRLDAESGVYDEHGVLQGRHWTHDQGRQTCTIDLVLAMQRGIDQAAPTATLRPTDTPLPTDPPWHPEEYTVVERTIDTANGAGIAVALLPTPRADWPANTPRPTYTPYPTATPSPLVSSVSWIGWANRPIAIEADGVVTMDVPRDADVSAQLSVWTGAHQTRQAMLAMLPLPDAQWEQGTARIRLQEGSGRILLSSDHVDAYHRSLRLRIQVAPLSDCDAPNLRWEKPAAVVIRALTEQPYADWRDQELPPTAIPDPATLNGLTLTGMNISPGFDPTIMNYAASVPYATSETTVRPVLTNPNDSYVINLAGARQSEDAPAVVELAAGVNNIAVVVASADGNTTETYTITVSREIPSTDASLGGLALDGATPDQWTPVFDPAVFDYDVRVPNATARISVIASPTESTATFAVSTDPLEALTHSGHGTALVELAEGATTTVTVTVTAEDGSTMQDYTVRVHRAGP